MLLMIAENVRVVAGLEPAQAVLLPAPRRPRHMTPFPPFKISA